VKEVITGTAAGAVVGAVQGAAESGSKAAGIAEETDKKESTTQEGSAK
jgi:hypothetical protein